MTNKRSKACIQKKKPAAPNIEPDIVHDLHLPWNLACLIQSPRTNRTSYMVVIKSWGSLPRECGNNAYTKPLPLVQIQLSNNIARVPSSQYQSSRRRKPFDMCHSLKFMGNSDGSLVWSNGLKFGDNYIMGSFHFADLESGIHRACVANAKYENHLNPNTYFDVVLTGICSPAILIEERPKSGINCDMGNLKWLKYGCNLVDPNDPGQGYMRLCMGIWFGDKFYALSLQGTLVVLQFGLEHDPLIMALGSGRAVPSFTTSSRHFREYLLDANGQILLVFLLSKKSVKIVDDVEVFGLDVSNLSWVRMRRLGLNTSLILGLNCCMAVNTSNVNSMCNSSCVYFTNQPFDGWKIYDMENGCIREWFGYSG